jgi:translocation and assembly module TamB
MKKKIALAGIGLACIFLVIGLTIFLYVKTDHAKNLLVDKINTAIPGTLLAENIEFSLISSYVKLDGIQIKDRQNTTCFKLKSLLLDLKISSLFRKVLEINSLTVKGPEISIVKDINGRINLIDALIPEDKKSPGKEIAKKERNSLPINVIVKKAQVIEGALTFNDSINSIHIKSLNIEINDADLMARHLSLTSRIKNSSITFKDKEILVNNLSFLTELEQGSKVDFKVELDSDLCVFKAKGIATDIFKAPGIDFNISTTSRLEQFNRFLENKTDLGGLAKVTLAGKGPINNPEVSFKLDVDNFKIDEDLKGDGINLSASIVDRIFSIKKGNLNILGSNIEFKGMADLKDLFPKGFLKPAQNPDTLKYDFSFNQKNGDFQNLGKWVKGFSGRFLSFGNIKGKGVRPESLVANYHFNLVLEDFKQDKPGTQFLDFKTDLSGTIEKGLCKIKSFNAKMLDTEIGITGQYDIFKKLLDANVNIKANDLNLYSTTMPLGLPAIKGSIDSQITMAGHIANPEVKAKVLGNNLALESVSINDLEFEGSINSFGHAEVKRLIIKDQDLVIDVKGSADVFEKGFKIKDVVNANMLVSGQNINPKRFFEPADIKIDQEYLNSLINFNLNVDVDYAGNASMDKINFYDKQIPVKNIHADIDLGKKEIEIKLEKIAVLNASLDSVKNIYHAGINFNHSDLAPLFKFAGIKGIKTHIDGQINAKGNIPVNIHPALTENLIKELYAAQGRISLNADVKGSIKEPEFNALVDLSNINYDLSNLGINIANLNSSIKATGDKININALSADLNEGHLRLAGNVGLKDYKIQDCKLIIFADSLDIPIPSKTGAKKSIFMEKFDSDLNVNLQYDKIASQNPTVLPEKGIPVKHVMADLNLNEPNLNDLYFSVLLDKTTDLKASFDPENSVYDLKFKFNKTLLTPIFKMAGLDEIRGSINGYATSKGKLNLDLPKEMMEGLKQTTGKIAIRADIKGSLEKPDFDAVITLSGIEYSIPQAKVTISNLNGKIKLLKDELEIENMAADIDKGSLNIKGKIGLKDYKPVKGNIQFKGNHIALELPDMATIEFNHDLVFSGTREKSDLSGTFQMIKGEYYKDFTFDLAEAMGDKKRETSISEPKSNTGIAMIQNTSLNIDVDYNDPFLVDNNLVFILVEPNVNISGTATNPVITGRAKIIEGTIMYQKKEFQIEKGIIDFVDPYKIDPDINLAAKTEIRNWTIHLKVSGKKDNLKFQLFSNPKETHEDILSLLIVGKTTKELGKGGGGSYTNILTDKASNIIGESVEESTPLDSFKVGYDDSGSQSSNVSVSLGKKLSKRMEVKYLMETVDEETVHTNAAEYKILENVMLKAFNDSKGDFGTEVTFKLEFR